MWLRRVERSGRLIDSIRILRLVSPPSSNAISAALEPLQQFLQDNGADSSDQDRCNYSDMQRVHECIGLRI
jgi:hypothetical protein